jgi:hypothetical protein
MTPFRAGHAEDAPSNGGFEARPRPSGEEAAALLKGRILELPVDFQRVAVYEAGFAPEIA